MQERFANDRCTIVIPRPYTGAQLQRALERLAIDCAPPGVEREPRPQD